LKTVRKTYTVAINGKNSITDLLAGLFANIPSVCLFAKCRETKELAQLCPTHGPHAAQSKVSCGSVKVVAVVKVS